jgi:hypothetical protein
VRTPGPLVEKPRVAREYRDPAPDNPERDCVSEEQVRVRYLGWEAFAQNQAFKPLITHSRGSAGWISRPLALHPEGVTPDSSLYSFFRSGITLSPASSAARFLAAPW